MKQLIVATLLLSILGTACNTDQKETTTDTGKQVDVQKMAANWTNWDTTTFRTMTSPNLVRYTNGAFVSSTQDAYVGMMNMFHKGFPDLNIGVDSSTQYNGRVYVYWTLTGTNTGMMGDAPPTNKKVKLNGFSVWFVDKEAICYQEDAFYDNLALQEQLGYTLTPPASK